MSKGNMLLGQARGKVGSLVFARVNGKQVTRAKAEVVKNPQSETQMISRIILNTVAQAYSNFQPIVDHSYEGVPKGQKSMSKFMKKNIDALRSKIAQAIAEGYDYDGVSAFTPIGDNTLYPNAYIMSSGSLPEVRPEFVEGSTVVAALPVSANTYQAVLDDLGLQRGDQLTFIACENVAAGKTGFFFTRVILDPTNADGSSAELSSAFVGADNAVNLPSPRNEGSFGTLSFAEGKISWNIKSATSQMFAIGIIVSRKQTDGSWLRSNCQLLVNDAAVTGVQPSLQYCLDLFYAGGIDALSDMYLNNAGRGRLAEANGDAQPFTMQAVTVNGERVSASSVATIANAETNVPVSVTLAESAPAGLVFSIMNEDGYEVGNDTSFTDGIASQSVLKSSFGTRTWEIVIRQGTTSYHTGYKFIVSQ